MEKQVNERRWATRAIRGATTVAHNSKEDIVNSAEELLVEIIKQNRLDSAEIASIIFTTTRDLDAEFPAVGARKIGLTDVPLLCATEIPVPGSLERCLRCLVHVNTTLTQDDVRHIYLHAARALRPDLT
jgi:chorismate mutase